MATASILFPINAGMPPDNTAGNGFAPVQRKQSSAAAPAPVWPEALMDAAADEGLCWAFRMPQNYASGLVVKIQYKMASATSGNVIMQGLLAAQSDGDSADIDAFAFDTANASSATAVPGTAGHLDEISITMTNADSVAAGDFCVLMVKRDADNGSDTATGDLELIAVSLEYTTT